VSEKLDSDVAGLLADPSTVKVLVTVGEDGTPHAVIKQSLHLDAEGNLVYLELLESSRTNRNMVRSIWYNRRVAILLKGKQGESYQIKGTPVKAIVSGPVFQQHYTRIRYQLGDVDLAAVWVIEPEAVIDESYAVRKAQEESLHPHWLHLDRLAKQSI